MDRSASVATVSDAVRELVKRGIMERVTPLLAGVIEVARPMQNPLCHETHFVLSIWVTASYSPTSENPEPS